jgi:cbb3-type cytochrome oxidase subunit 1
MKNADRWFIAIAAVFAMLGMTFGIAMGMRGDFTYADVHAHANLVGWVTLAIFGLAYRSYPKMAECRLTAVHFCVAITGAVLFVPGIFIVIKLHSMGPVILGSLLTLASTAIFLVNFLRHRNA